MGRRGVGVMEGEEEHKEVGHWVGPVEPPQGVTLKPLKKASFSILTALLCACTL